MIATLLYERAFELVHREAERRFLKRRLRELPG
jgi:predicted RNA polymerase sigma factor